jgi:thiol-disulfide isomerase/thioredoxin
MNRLILLAGFTVLLGTRAECGEQTEVLPGEQYAALAKKYEQAVENFEKPYLEGKIKEEWDLYYEKNFPRPEEMYPEFMALAKKFPKEAATVDALIWVVTHASLDPKNPETQKQALETIRRDHLASEKLPLVFDYADEDFLNEVFEKSPLRESRGIARYTIAENHLAKMRMVSRWRASNPDWAKRWKWLEQTHNAFLVTTDLKELSQKCEKLLEALGKNFAEVPISGRRNGETIGALAKSHLYELRQLGIGKPAPELKSIDLDGQPVNLSDLKGRVVVLDVWATWCGPCLAMIPEQRALVKRLKHKPFTLVSINADEKQETLTEFLKKNPMPWTHWYTGTEGNLIADLNVWFYPRIYVLDSKGVIRFKDVQGKVLEQAVDSLLKEMEEEK